LAADRGGLRLKTQALLFSKKSKKNFAPCRRCPQHGPAGAKVFWFFFSKKNGFLYFPFLPDLA
jgi:hypothetical protein